MPRAFSNKVLLIYAGLIAGNIAAWAWAFAIFGGNAALMGTAILAYTLGLRHAVDADHIAAIDNVTRKLVQDGQKPTGVGLFFSLGHSTVVILACAGIALLSAALTARFAPLRELGTLIGTTVSASFLIIIAAANIVTLVAILRAMRKPSAPIAPLPGGPLGRLLKPVMNMIGRSWQMYPLGFLFGLGFDTATEVALLGISAAQAHHAVPFWTIMVFPALFTAGMSLIDATDGILMTRLYGWALVWPSRKLVYKFDRDAVFDPGGAGDRGAGSAEPAGGPLRAGRRLLALDRRRQPAFRRAGLRRDRRLPGLLGTVRPDGARQCGAGLNYFFVQVPPMGLMNWPAGARAIRVAAVAWPAASRVVPDLAAVSA